MWIYSLYEYIHIFYYIDSLYIFIYNLYKIVVIKYPAQNKEIMLKTFDSRIKNKTNKFSKKEDEIFNYLITIDNDTKR